MIKRFVSSATFALALCLGAATPLSAQSSQIAAEEGVDWEHKWSDLVAPSTLGEYRRGDLVDYGQSQQNIGIFYHDDATQTTVTLYLYRSRLLDVSVWADRATIAMLSNPQLGTVDGSAAKMSTYTPNNSSGADTGYRMVTGVLNGNATSTGVTLHPHDEWLVKVRMTSFTLSINDMDARLAAFVDDVKIGSSQVQYTAVAPISECTTKLNASKSKRVEVEMADIILMSTLFNMGKPQEAKDNAPEARDYCRDQASAEEYGIYRAGGTKDGYAIALGDAGVSATAGLSSLPMLNEGKPNYSLILGTPEEGLIYQPFKKLPTPKQAIEAIYSERPVTTVTFSPDGDGSTVNVPMPAG